MNVNTAAIAHTLVVLSVYEGATTPVRGRRGALMAAGTHVAAPGAVASRATHHHHGESVDSGGSRYSRASPFYVNE